MGISHTIHVDDYPQLAILAWNRAVRDIEEEEVLALYETNWRFVEPDRLIPKERDLINQLVRRYGHGVLNV
jgi:hypothetical protein